MVGIIGAGISGLSLAYHLEKAKVPYILFEASDNPGGYIRTINQNGCLLECGPNSILADREIVDFIKEIGLSGSLREAEVTSKNRYIFKDGSIKKLPAGPISLLLSDFFSANGKWSIIKEYFNNSKGKTDETVREFFQRRFGDEIVDYAVDPFVSGIYAGDPDLLLISETFPILQEYEQKYGSVIKGFIKNPPERKFSYNFDSGMQQLTDTIAKKLTCFSPGTQVERIRKENNKYVLEVLINNEPEFHSFDFLVLCLPAYKAAPLLENIAEDFAKTIEKIDYPPVVIVHSLFNKGQFPNPPDGFGVLNPAKESRFSAGTIWNYSSFPYKCSKDYLLLTSIIGGSQSRSKFHLPDKEIIIRLNKEFKEDYNIKGEPIFQKITRIDKAIPQYDKNIVRAKDLAKNYEKDNIFVCSSWISGVSVADCFKKGKLLAQKISSLRNTVL
ncbi:MAG: protoporphyrinogen oxidase [Cytophagaceae bacterium]